MSMTSPDAAPATGAGRTVTAFFDTREAAQAATDDLVAAGVARERISMVEGGPVPIESEAVPTAEKGFWASLKDLFLPDDDHYGYAEGLRRGGYLLAVRDDGEHHQRIVDILDRDGTVDMDQRRGTWRSEGWDPDRAGRDLMAEESLGRAAVLPTAEQPASAQSAAAGATVPRDDLLDAYRGAPVAPSATPDDAMPADERTPGRTTGRRAEDLGRARVRSYLDEGL